MFALQNYFLKVKKFGSKVVIRKFLLKDKVMNFFLKLRIFMKELRII